jgi:hypothetical protein
MARFNRRHYDCRGPEYDERYGRYEGAFACRAALDAWLDGAPHGPRGYPPSPTSDRARHRQAIPPAIDCADAYSYDLGYVERTLLQCVDARGPLRTARHAHVWVELPGRRTRVQAPNQF